MVVALAAWGIAYAVLAVVLVGLGLALTQILLPAGLGSVDTSVSRWFVLQRTPTLNIATRLGSDLGSTGAIVGVAAVAIAVLAIGKHWRRAGFLVCALTLEFAVFLTATLAVDRARPSVPRLDPAPVTSSYPSGHAAAALTLYVGLAIVLMSFVRSALVRAIVWVLAIALPLIVGLSRLYRGMHHLTDVTASALLASGALVFALLTVRSVVAAAAERDEDAERSLPTRPEVEVAS